MKNRILKSVIFQKEDSLISFYTYDIKLKAFAITMQGLVSFFC